MSREVKLDRTALAADCARTWDESITPAITEYIRIPNKSPEFDPDWEANGHMERATQLIVDWCRQQAVPGLEIRVERLPGRTPLIFMELPGASKDGDCILLYGHLDKQPEMSGWSEGLGPWTPVLRGDRLYGRGGADDGYAAFASVTALAALKRQGIALPRCVVMIEASEESGSDDLPHYIEALKDRIGQPSLVVCLDSGCGNYDQLWCTTSLRGMVAGELKVRVLEQGVHSGDGTGVIPSSFRIARLLIDRLEDLETGAIKLAALSVPIPADRKAQAKTAAEVLLRELHGKFPFAKGVRPISEDGVELVLGRTWRPGLEVTGAEGLPAIRNAGNVLRPETSLKLSLRLPPTCDSAAAYRAVKAELERDPPYGAQVSFAGDHAQGWNAPAMAPWLEQAIERASQDYFQKTSVAMGEGGSIPFMAMLGKRFPKAQFFITGVLGPESNAHGPNEFLHLPTGKRLTACVASVLVDHARTFYP